MPAGDYEYPGTRRADIGNGRKINGNANASWGDFWNGA